MSLVKKNVCLVICCIVILCSSVRTQEESQHKVHMISLLIAYY